VKQIISTKKAPDAVGTYSQGVKYNGVYYFSGQIGINPETNEMMISFDDQLEQIMKNIDGLLESQNLTRDNIVKTTIFLQDLSDFSKVNDKYTQYFSSPYPARSCIQAARLPKDALVEIEVIAGK
tara:strand:- start:520 stop:894 length:375 start_codon:yes stop_codon:yes gene_type:complete